MNWKEMDLDELFKYIETALRKGNMVELEKLASDSELIRYMEEIYANDRCFGYRKKIDQILERLKKAKNVIELHKVFENPQNYSVADRRKIIELASQPAEDGAYLHAYGQNFRNMISYIRSNFNDLKTHPELEKEELEAVEIFKKILEFKEKNNNQNGVCRYIFLDLGIGIKQETKLKSMKNELLKAFIKSMMYETTTKVFGEISLENMRIIDSTIKYFNDTFPKKIYSDVINSIPEITKEKEEKITKLLNLIHLLEERYNYNYYKIVYVLTHDCNISREMLKDEYLPLCVVYSTNRFKGTPKEKEIFSRIYTFLFIITETYSSIMNGHDNLKTYIISNINNKQILEELYFVLFFHKATPDSNKNRFHLYLEFEGKEELEKFALGYKEYYKENIKKQEQLKKEINDKKQAEQYLELLPRYERIIKDYIESGLYIDSYCKKIGINQADFRKIVNELKKHNHPLFEEYSKHANSVANTNYTIIKRYIDKMIKNLMADPGKYTLLDYYGDTKMSFKEARSILSQASNEAKKAFETFCKKYQNDHPIKREQAKAIGKEFPIGKVNGETVRREATEEEKEQALNMLDEKGIPLTLATFSEQLRRIVQNSIEPQHTGGQK